MKTLLVAGNRLVMTHFAAADDSETLEFWHGPGPGRDDLAVAFTLFESDRTKLLVHVPGETSWTVVLAASEIACDWMAKNMPSPDERGETL